MDEVLKKIGQLGLVPVVKITDAKDAIPLGKALIAGDLPVAEITFRTDAAEESIKRIASELPDMLLGAGTVLTEDQAERAVAAGAKFIVAPGFNPKIVDWCVDKGVPVTPGVNSPSQIEMAMERSLTVLKFFPAEASGGLAMLKAMSGPYGGIKFIPTGGINAGNLAAYLASPLIHACGGSWLAKTDVIASGNFEEVTRVTREAVSLVLGFEMAHVGINEGSDKKAEGSARFFTDVFQFPLKVGFSSVFAGSGIEITKKPVQGTHGHIAINTNNIERAVAYLQRKGLKTDPGSVKTKDAKMSAIYLEGEVSGFAVHLLQK